MANPTARSISKSGLYRNPTPIENRSLYKSKVTPQKRAGKASPFQNGNLPTPECHITQTIKYQSTPILNPSNNRVTQYSKYF